MTQYQVTFGEAIQRAFSKYCAFSGRASRSEYWFFTLFCFIISCGFSMVTSVLSESLGETLSGVFSLAVFLPSLGLVWRRLHDMGKAGGYFFIFFIPVAGWIILLYWLCQPSQPDVNRFGDVPNLVP